jgi:MoCo/4Fe-4S cofactor protein with predicted Tat translocation signal
MKSIPPSNPERTAVTQPLEFTLQRVPGAKQPEGWTPTATGRRYWRSLDELGDTPEFKQWLEREFPEGSSEFTDRCRGGILSKSCPRRSRLPAWV